MDNSATNSPAPDQSEPSLEVDDVRDERRSADIDTVKMPLSAFDFARFVVGDGAAVVPPAVLFVGREKVWGATGGGLNDALLDEMVGRFFLVTRNLAQFPLAEGMVMILRPGNSVNRKGGG